MSAQPDREAMLDSVALYALGVLPREEAALIAAFIANDDDARREYLELRASADALAQAAEEPVDSARSARMKERLMARVRADAAAASAPQPRGTVTPRRATASYPAWLWGTGLAAAAAIVFAVVTVAQDLTLRGDLAAADRRVALLQSRIAQNERAAAQDRQMLGDLFAPDAKRYDVADGTVVVRGDRLYVALAKLPPLPKGHVYQAWTAVKGSEKMAPGPTFVPNPGSMTIVPLRVDATRVGTVAVSVEPEGGSKAPTSTPTFVRQLT
ncbi:MAG TPA: anti-sigma factor [Candidatus Elarobacter sp.]|jgi:anti-sigma-K factor RskA|nr:anti-sigma factor [Candidatus Elarobacter sp.]